MCVYTLYSVPIAYVIWASAKIRPSLTQELLSVLPFPLSDVNEFFLFWPSRCPRYWISAVGWSYKMGSSVLKWKCPLTSTFVVKPLDCHFECLLVTTAKLWHGERSILLSRQDLIKSPFEVNRKIPVDLNRLWNKPLIVRYSVRHVISFLLPNYVQW